MASRWQDLNRQIESLALDQAKGLIRGLLVNQSKYQPQAVNELEMEVKAFLLCPKDKTVTYLRRIESATSRTGTSKRFSEKRLEDAREIVSSRAKPWRDEMSQISQGNWALVDADSFVEELRLEQSTQSAPTTRVGGAKPANAVGSKSHADPSKTNPSTTAEQLEASKRSEAKVNKILQAIIAPVLDHDLSPKEKAMLVERFSGLLGLAHQDPQPKAAGARPAPKKAPPKPKYPKEVQDLAKELEDVKTKLSLAKKAEGDLPPNHPLVTARKKLLDEIAAAKLRFRESSHTSTQRDVDPVD